MRQQICFIRHGETVANEQNIFAGIWDVPLTDLGRKQAEVAGKLIKAKGYSFDRLHVSTLSRAQITARLALAAAGHPELPTTISADLAERDFGECTRKNKNLLRKTYGYRQFEEILHSPDAAPRNAENFTEMYRRVHAYYHEVLLPEAEAGQRILVVCHKYIIEMFALVIAGYGPADYFDFRLPNAAPMTEDELVGYIRSESRLLKEVGDRTIFHSASLIVGAAVLGVLGKSILAVEIPAGVFLPLVCLLLAASSFFATMAVNIAAIVKDFDIRKSSPLPWIMKIVIVGLMCFWLRGEKPASDMLMIFLMPPALTVPALSLLWGGSLKTAVTKTFCISLLVPFYLGALLLLQGSGEWPKIINFMTILFVAFILPTLISQGFRLRQPIKSAKFADRWKWLGIASIIMLAGLLTYRFTPANLTAMLVDDSKEFQVFLNCGWEVLVVFGLVKISAYVAGSCGKKELTVFIDEYITHSTPNLFLWISCVSWQGQAGYLAFWSVFLFFCGIFFDERFFIHLFKSTNEHGWQRKVWIPMPELGSMPWLFAPVRITGRGMPRAGVLERHVTS